MVARKIVYFVSLIVLLLAFTALGCESDLGEEDATSVEPEESADVAEVVEEEVVLRLGSIHAAEDLATQGLRMLAEIAEEKSGGTLIVEVYPAEQLGDAISQMEAVMMGTQDMFFGAGGFMTQFVPDNGVSTVFFAFEDDEHFIRYLESGIVDDIEAQFLEERNARVIDNNWRRSPRVMLSNVGPIQSLDDMDGLKVRVPEIQTYLESVKALGANPTPVPWGEVYLALTQGVVDACESPIDMIPDMSFHEAAPHVTITNHIYENDILMINEDKYQALSESQRSALYEAAIEAGSWYNDSVADNINIAKEKMEEDGATLYEVDVVPFIEVMMEAAEQLENEGLWQEGLFESIQELR